jgi:hypothetical protein
MITFQKVTLIMVFLGLFVSCQAGTDVSKILSKQETRKVVMDTIANNSAMSMEMMDAMMNSKNGKMTMMGNDKMAMMMMMENRASMIKMMKENPAMMQNMWSDMMEISKNNPDMMNMMQNRNSGNMEMKGMNMTNNKSIK